MWASAPHDRSGENRESIEEIEIIDPLHPGNDLASWDRVTRALSVTAKVFVACLILTGQAKVVWVHAWEF